MAAGEEFVTKLHKITRASIAASISLGGYSATEKIEGVTQQPNLLVPSLGWNNQIVGV